LRNSYDFFIHFLETESKSALISIRRLIENCHFRTLFNEDNFTKLIKELGHESHKKWDKTLLFSEQLEKVFFPGDSENKAKLENENCSALFRSIFERVLRDGNYDSALAYAKERLVKGGTNEDTRPWVVLVTGVNGIRKTTTVYQNWYATLLSEALTYPNGSKQIDNLDALPLGSNSFFRQLDHMIAVLANEQFALLYSIEQTAPHENRKAVDAYSKFKDAVFARYRTLSEMVGIIFVRDCIRSKMNIMIETSGRDASMFNYVNSLFDDDSLYRKLVLRFTINDIRHAERSVDRRMQEEMKRGIEILHDLQEDREEVKFRKIIDVNAGGPYGSTVLQGVQAEADNVWGEMCTNSVIDGWYKASFQISGSEDGPWTATAVLPDGSLGSTFEFPLRK